jgi:transcriptional regulator GlxA family with amidase domain
LGSTPIAELTRPADTLVVAGGFGVARARHDALLVEAIREAAAPARRVASVCTGALLLAAAGLLDGRRATTHWSSTARLASDHPTVDVDGEPIFVRDGKYWTSAGVTTGLDLSLALVADDLGDEISREIARWLVMFLRRPGGQSQFSPHLDAATATSAPLRAVQDWLPDHLDHDLSNAALARIAGMSERHFTRRFRHEVGVSPAAHVARLRVEAAKHLLADEGTGLATIAHRCGFGTVETFHRVFRRTTGTTPDRYRQHFATPVSPAIPERS